MKRGDKITIERTLSGHYKVTAPAGDLAYVGGAASTIVVIANAVFSTEAGEIPEFVVKPEKT